MKRFKENDVIFDEEVAIFEDYQKLYVYLWETDIFDKIAKLYTEVNHSEDFCVNYYGVYDLYTKSFNVEVDVTYHVSKSELKIDFPKVVDKIEEYIEENVKGREVYLDLSKEELEMIFEKFKKYCVLDFKEEYPQINTFEELEKELAKNIE